MTPSPPPSATRHTSPSLQRQPQLTQTGRQCCKNASRFWLQRKRSLTNSVYPLFTVSRLDAKQWQNVALTGARWAKRVCVPSRGSRVLHMETEHLATSASGGKDKGVHVRHPEHASGPGHLVSLESDNPRARCLSRYGHDFAEQRIEVEYVRARRALYRVRDELGSRERCVERLFCRVFRRGG